MGKLTNKTQASAAATRRVAVQRVVRPTYVELSEAYAEAAQHLEMCACEEQDPSQKAANNKVSEKLYKRSIAIAQSGRPNGGAMRLPRQETQ